MKLHRAAQNVEIFLAPVANQAAKLVNASRLHVDDDRDHHFPEQIRGWVMVQMLL
jgi:hypothetical protein